MTKEISSSSFYYLSLSFHSFKVPKSLILQGFKRKRTQKRTKKEEDIFILIRKDIMAV